MTLSVSSSTISTSFLCIGLASAAGLGVGLLIAWQLHVAAAKSATATAASSAAALASERAGRVRAERALRAGGGVSGGYPLLRIGVVRSPFRGRWGSPRQGMLAPAARAVIALSPAMPAASVSGLSEFSHVHVLFLFHENSCLHKLGEPPRGKSSAADEALTADERLRRRRFNAVIEAPALHGGRTGVLATRSPHRPNAVGLSLCRLLAVRTGASGGAELVLAGCDLIEGTPVVDVKPFAPYDCASCIGSWLRGDEAVAAVSAAAVPKAASTPAFVPARNIADARTALVSGADFADAAAFSLRGPDWVFDSLREQATARLAVVWLPGTAEAAAAAAAAGRCRYYGSGAGEAAQLQLALTQTLALDIRAVHHGRGGAPSAGRGGAPLTDRMGPPPPPVHGRHYYELFFDTLGVRFAVVDDDVATAGAASARSTYHVEVLDVQVVDDLPPHATTADGANGLISDVRDDEAAIGTNL